MVLFVCSHSSEHRHITFLVKCSPFHEAKPERVAIPRDVGHDIRGGYGHVVELMNADPARHIALRPVGEGGYEFGGRAPSFCLPINFMQGASPSRVTVTPPPAPFPLRHPLPT